MSKPGCDPCLASEANPSKLASQLLVGVNQQENHGDIGRHSLVTSAWADQVLTEWNEWRWPKKGEQVLIVPRWEFSDLNLEDRLGQLRALLRLLL